MTSLIVNSPYVAPTRHWQQGADGGLTLLDSRRAAGYEIFDVRNNTRRTENLEADRSIVKKSRGSDKAFTRRVLGKLSAFKEIKGEDSEQNRAKRAALDVWVRADLHGGFGVWAWDVAFEAARIRDILDHHCRRA